MNILHRLRDETFTYPIPTIRMQKYSLNKLLEKNLLFLLPFYIFTYDKRMKDVNADIQKLNALKNEFQLIVRHLDHLEYQGLLSAYYKRTLIEMSEKVVDNLAANYENVKEGVKSVMGGKVLEYEAKTILRQGERQGEQKGIRQGRLDALVETIKNLMETMGWTAEQAMDNMKISTDDRIIISSRL